MQRTLSVLVVYLVCFFSISLNAAEAGHSGREISLGKYLKRPKLVVVIVIDQGRSDFLTRYASRFSKTGGYRQLMETGAYFPFAKFNVLQSMTCPGHATILTGAYPYQMGIPLNDWYDSQKKLDVYCAEDSKSPIVGRQAKPADGMSPRRLQGSTLGDELKTAYPSSRVVTVALKDRAAIMLGGHRADLALWNEEGHWVSSQYYLSDLKLPAWVITENEMLESQKGKTFQWKAAGPSTGLSVPATSTAAREVKIGTDEALGSPFGVKMTTDLALKAFEAMKLGQGTSTDILGVGYSTHDILGHQKGMQSPELEELSVIEDESLGLLLNTIKKKVKQEDLVVVLTGDHGVAPAVEIAKANKLPAGYIESKILLEEVNATLKAKWGESAKGPWILRVRSFNFFLNPDAIADKKKERAEVENEVKRILIAKPGIAHAFSRSDVESRRLPPGLWEKQILNTYNADKNGDVVIIPKPFWVEKGAFATHMTGYQYDRNVPLIFSGARFRAGVYSTPAEVVDLAPTLAFILGVVPPSGADGRVLSEAIQ